MQDDNDKRVTNCSITRNESSKQRMSHFYFKEQVISMESRDSSSFLFLAYFPVPEENSLRVKVIYKVIVCLGNIYIYIYIERRDRIRHFHS